MHDKEKMLWNREKLMKVKEKLLWDKKEKILKDK